MPGRGNQQCAEVLEGLALQGFTGTVVLEVTMRRAANRAEREAGLAEAKGIERTTVLVIDTDPLITTVAGGHWWDVAVPEVSVRAQVNAARKAYEEALDGQKL